MQMNTSETVSQLNSLLRGELSAVETYQQALSSLSASETSSKIRTMCADHESAVSQLRQQVHEHGGEPAEGSGAWGIWAKLVTGTAAAISEGTVLKALKEGEEHGVKEYEETKQTVNVSPFALGFLEARLTKQRENIQALNGLMAQ